MKELKELIKYSRLAAEKGLTVGPAGNVSFRVKDRMFLKASGIWMSELRLKDLVEVDLNSLKTIGRSRLCPSCEFRFHAAIYVRRPEIKCVMHTHPVYATVLGRKTCFQPELCPEFGVYLKTAAFLPKMEAGSEELARKVGEAAGHELIYLQAHGIIALGQDVKQAFLRSLLAERMARMVFLGLMVDR